MKCPTLEVPLGGTRERDLPAPGPVEGNVAYQANDKWSTALAKLLAIINSRKQEKKLLGCNFISGSCLLPVFLFGSADINALTRSLHLFTYRVFLSENPKPEGAELIHMPVASGKLFGVR